MVKNYTLIFLTLCGACFGQASSRPLSALAVPQNLSPSNYVFVDPLNGPNNWQVANASAIMWPTSQITNFNAAVTALIPAVKRTETFSGTTNASGQYTVTFGTAFATAPNVQANIINGTDTQNIRTTSVTTTGFTVVVRNRVDVIGLLPTWNNVTGANIDVLVTAK